MPNQQIVRRTQLYEFIFDCKDKLNQSVVVGGKNDKVKVPPPKKESIELFNIQSQNREAS